MGEIPRAGKPREAPDPPELGAELSEKGDVQAEGRRTRM